MSTCARDDKAFVHPTTTESQNRLPLFAAVISIKNNRDLEPITYTTSYGTCTVSGVRLTQRHKDLIEAVFAHYLDAIPESTGEVTYLIDVYRTMKAMGLSHSDTRWLAKLCEDLRLTRFAVTEGNFNEVGGIVSHYYWENATMTIGADGKYRRGHFGIRFSASYLQIFQHELNIHYRALTEQVLAIASPLVKATVRFFLTHSDSKGKGWRGPSLTSGLHKDIPGTIISQEKLLVSLGEQPPHRDYANSYEGEKLWEACRRKWRRKIKELDANEETLKSFGIIKVGTNYCYNKHDKVWFHRPSTRLD